MNSTSANMVPEASACAVSGSVSGPVSAPSCPGLCSRPWMSSFTVYTNNSIYKGIRPVEKGGERTFEDMWLWPIFVIQHTPGSLHFLKLP